MKFLALPVLVTSLLAMPAAGDEPKPKSKLPLGKETTYVTGPLDKNGFIDYQTALNERLSKGITPEKNACALLWKAMGPKPEGGNGMPAEFFKWLGTPELPEQGDYLIGLHRFMQDRLKLDREEFQGIYDQQNYATQRPWAAAEYPVLAAWLTDNQKPLAVAVEATRRPDYFNPLVSRRSENDPGSLIGVLLPAVQKCREIASALAARAMLRTGEGKFDDAWQDLLAVHRLGRHLAKGATLIEGLVGIALEQIATTGDLAYLDRAKLNAKQIQERLKDLQSLPPLAPVADKIDLGERFMFLDSVQLLRRGGLGMLDGIGGGPPRGKPTAEELKALDQIDWEPALRNGNKFYDRMAAALRLPTRAERLQELAKIEDEVKKLKTDAKDIEKLAPLLLGKEPSKLVGKQIGDILITLLLPAVQKVSDSHDRAMQVRANLHIAFALAAYRTDTGRYPAKLDDLAPKYLAAVPGDLFSGKALIYKPEEKGYLLYSVGVNGIDEGGRWFDDEPRGDDPRVRMPLPELKKK